MKTRTGDIIKLMLDAEYDVAIHGVNCMSTQKSGLAAQMSDVFKTDSSVYFNLESPSFTMNAFKFKENKLGCIEYAEYYVNGERAIFVNDLTRGRRNEQVVTIVNCYTQAYPGKGFYSNIPLNYAALELCLMKVNHQFKGKTLALPKIGAGLARGYWDLIAEIVERTLTDIDYTLIELP